MYCNKQTQNKRIRKTNKTPINQFQNHFAIINWIQYSKRYICSTGHFTFISLYYDLFKIMYKHILFT